MRRAPLLLIVFLVSRPGLCSFNAGTAWEVRTSAADANGGGGFVNTSNLATPSAPTTGTATSGGTVAANTYYAIVCYLDGNGNQGPKSAQTAQATTGATSTLTVTSPAASTGAVSYAVWWTTTNGGPYWPSPGTAVAIGTNSTRTTTPATSGTQPPGTDYSQQDAAQIAYTDVVVQATTTTAISVLNPFTPAMVGNVLNVTSGGTAQRAQITAVSAGAVATFDKSLGAAAQICVGNLGGALQSLTAAAGLVVAGNAAYIKSGTYSEALTLVASGAFGFHIYWIGYGSSRGDAPTGTARPLIDAASARANCVAASTTNGNVFAYLRGSGGTAANFDMTTGSAMYVGCKSSSSATDGWKVTNGALYLLSCEAASNTGMGVNAGTYSLNVVGSYVHDNASNGATWGNGAAGVCMYSVFDTNAATAVTIAQSTVVSIVSNTFYGQTGASSDGLGLNGSGVRPPIIIDNIFDTNGQYGVSRTSAASQPWLDYNDFHANATAAMSNVIARANNAVADPQFSDAPNGNFSLGGNLKALGYPGLFPGGLSTGYLDIGAVQRQESSGGGFAYACWGQ